MAETQRVTSSSASSRPAPKPRLRHPPRHNPLPRMAAPPPTPPKPAVVAAAPSVPEVSPAAPRLRSQLPPRSPAEWVILAVLLCGLGLNVVALLTASRLSRSDLLLGATVLLAGIVLLVLIELCRRSAPCAADED